MPANANISSGEGTRRTRGRFPYYIFPWGLFWACGLFWTPSAASTAGRSLGKRRWDTVCNLARLVQGRCRSKDLINFALSSGNSHRLTLETFCSSCKQLSTSWCRSFVTKLGVDQQPDLPRPKPSAVIASAFSSFFSFRKAPFGCQRGKLIGACK